MNTITSSPQQDMKPIGLDVLLRNVWTNCRISGIRS